MMLVCIIRQLGKSPDFFNRGIPNDGKENDPVQSVLNGQPQRNMTFSMRGTYGFKDRYFIEGNFGYNGSERFC